MKKSLSVRLSGKKNAEFDVFAIVFSGGTALSKSQVKIMRMSEDVDLKVIPYSDLDWQSVSRSERKRIRKCFHEQLLSLIVADGVFSIAGEVIKRDEHRYIYPIDFELQRGGK